MPHFPFYIARQFYACSLFLLFYFPEARSQSYSYKQFSVDDGLLSSTVYCGTQDGNGFIWFGTEAGVNRFNGKTFEKYTRDDGLSDNEVTHIYADSRGRVWFLTVNGWLSYYYKGAFYNPSNDSSLKNAYLGASIINAYEDSRHYLWFTSLYKGAICLKPNGEVRLYNGPELIQEFNFLFPYEDLQGHFYFFGNNSFIKTENDSFIRIPNRTLVKRENNYVKRGDAVFVSADGLIECTDTVQELIYPYSAYVNPGTITAIMKTISGRIFINTQGACWELVKTAGKKRELKKFFSGIIAMNVLEDYEGNIWLSTSGKGIILFSKNHSRFQNFTKTDGLDEDQVYSVTKTDDGALWLGCNRGIVTRIMNGEIRNYHLYDSMYYYNRVRFLYTDHNSVWCGCDRGVKVIYPDNSVKWIDVRGHFPTNKETAIKCLNTDRNGNPAMSFFFGNATFVKDQKDAPGYFYILQPTYGFRTYAHFYDHDNRLWVSNTNGLNIYENGRLLNAKGMEEMAGSRIVYINETPDSALILVTDGEGVYFYKNNRIMAHVNGTNGLPSSNCRKVIVKPDHLWVCTNQGISRFTYANGIAGNFRNFNSSSGLLSDNVFDLYEDTSRVYIATDRGLCIIREIFLVEKTGPPPVYIQSVISDNKKLDPMRPIRLNHDRNRLIINYAAIAFTNPDKVTYEYLLREEDTSWISTTNTSLELSNLSPGKYNFRLRAKKQDSVWSTPVSMLITVTPPFWQSWWFLLIGIVVIIWISIYSYRYYETRKLRAQLEELKKNEAISDERNRIAADMHDDLGSELTKISILSNIIKSQQKESTLNKNVLRIGELSDNVLERMDEIIWALNPAHDSMKDFVSYLRQTLLDMVEHSNLTLDFVVTDFPQTVQLSSRMRRNLFLVIKEAVHNVLKHAEATQVRVQIDYSDKTIRARVKDNGIGFEYLIPDATRNGTGNMEKRILEINGKLSIRSKNGQGTEVEIEAQVIEPVKINL